MKMPSSTRLIVSAGMIACLTAVVVAAPPIPAHPKDLNYPALSYEVPPAAQFRAVLSNGVVVYIAEDRLLPTFDLSITIRSGAAFEPAGKAGLASFVGSQMRDGGTRSLTPEEVDEKVEFLAARMFTSIGDTRGSAGLSLLSKDIDEGLALLIEMMRYPRFDPERLRLAKEGALQNIKRRNDATASISGIEWGFLMDGENHFSNRYPSAQSINAITREDLVNYHQRFVHPGNMIITVAGDFERADMLARLDRALADWPVGETAPRTFPAPTHTPTPGVYMMHKDGVNQGRVAIGHKSIVRGSQDEYALRVMNAILGGGSFRSRLVTKVRSNEGLAYNVGSAFGQGVYYPGDFQCWFQSKSNSCAYAAKIVMDEINRIRTELPPQVDVDDAIANFAESYPQRFGSKMAILGTYARDEYTGRDSSFWQHYIENIKAVTADDVLRVAKKYLHPDHLVILAVGDVEAIKAGGHSKNPDLGFASFGKITKLPLRDADTLKR